jgi:hypothetical protein
LVTPSEFLSIERDVGVRIGTTRGTARPETINNVDVEDGSLLSLAEECQGFVQWECSTVPWLASGGPIDTVARPC